MTLGSGLTQNQRLPGQTFDSESGLHQNGARDYDPVIGQYIESDPIGLRGGTNTYAYAMGNPVRFIDPLGTSCAAVSGAWACQIDNFIGNKDDYGQQIADFNRAYSDAVNELACHPGRTTTVQLPNIGPDGQPTGSYRSGEITAGELAKILEKRQLNNGGLNDCQFVGKR